ncbi:DUF4339 domain-containing protein [Chlamydia sp.]|uniref:DUF4339 domain-containing protein n=1 Tax=Chlamydia sp. TaxID=35827 RepID=UPI0025C3E87A|nr:DUF4339 domain-containing protein [Chlamydia sp.]MBQ8498566.1 DUF4339 domain-containing protein [Chlamydia sp.]
MNSGMFPFTFFLLYICLGMLTAYLATKKNRNSIGWFLAGMFFGIFAVIFILILPPLPSSNQDHDSTELKDSEDFFLQNTLEDSEIIAIPDTISQVTIDTEKWFYLSKDRTNVGPISIVQLIAFLKECKNSPEKGVSPQELWVWKKGMQNWEKVKNIPELFEIVKNE